jgi:ATP synthase protein I
MIAPGNQHPADHLSEAAHRAAERAKAGRENPEPSLGARLGQVGILGWTIVVPTLAGLFLGRWLDRVFATNIQFSATLLMLGAIVGFWSAWKWMRRF